MEAFANGDVDRVHLIYNEFRSVLTQRVVVEQLLPIPRTALDRRREAGEAGPACEYLYDPAPEQLFTTLLPRTSKSRSTGRCSNRTRRSMPRR